MNIEKFIEISQEYVEKIYITAKDCFGNGIYIKSDNHPCGWDFIDFDLADLEVRYDVMVQPIPIDAFNDGNYSYHKLEDKTLYEIIKSVGMTGWCFEISGVDNLR